MTNIEKKLHDELVRRGITFEFQFPTHSRSIIDFAFPGKRLAVECDGAVWHVPGNTRDRFRDHILRRGGWTILRFTEQEIVEDASRCVDIIAEGLSRLA
jgi:very-short-patch-repair endonuclease